MGKFNVDLDSLPKEETHTITKNLEEGTGTITLVITVSGTLGSHAASDLLHYREDEKEQKAIIDRYVSFPLPTVRVTVRDTFNIQSCASFSCF